MLKRENLIIIPLLVLYPSILFNFIAPYHQVLAMAFLGLFIFLNKCRVTVPLVAYVGFLISIIFQIAHFLYTDLSGMNEAVSALLRTVFIFVILVAYFNADKLYIIRVITAIIVFILLGNAVSFFAVLMLDISPIFELPLHDGRVAGLYIASFSAVDMQFSGFRFLRGSGVFDEPGAFGFVTFLLMVINYKYFRNVRLVITMYLLGVFTFSIAFIILSTIYIALTMPIRSSFRYIIIIILIGVTLISFIPEDRLDIVYHYSVGRIASLYAETGQQLSSSNTRAHVVAVARELIEVSPWLGVGETVAYQYSKFFSTASLVSYVAIYGILGYIFYSMPMWLVMTQQLSQVKISYADLLSILLILMLFIQRPYWDLPLNYILLFATVQSISNKEK